MEGTLPIRSQEVTLPRDVIMYRGVTNGGANAETPPAWQITLLLLFDLRFDPTYYKSQLLLHTFLSYACLVSDYLTTTEDE